MASCVKWHAQSLCILEDISLKKHSWKLEYVVSIIYNKQHNFFLKLLANEIHTCNFFQFEYYIGRKVTKSESLRKIHSSKDFGMGTFNVLF